MESDIITGLMVTLLSHSLSQLIVSVCACAMCMSMIIASALVHCAPEQKRADEVNLNWLWAPCG